MESSKRWHIAIEVALIEFLCTAGVGCYIAHMNDAELAGYTAVVGVPACAAALFIALCCFFANVIDPPVVKWPLTFTLPLIYTSLLPVSSILIAAPERALMATQETLSFAHVWLLPTSLVVVFLGQIVAVSLFAALSHRSV